MGKIPAEEAGILAALVGDVHTLPDPVAAKVLHILRTAVHMAAAEVLGHPAHMVVDYTVQIHKLLAGYNRDLEEARDIQVGCNLVPDCIRHIDRREEEEEEHRPV